MSMYIYVSKCIFVFLGYGGTGGHPEHARGGDFYSCFDGHVCAYWGGCCEYQPGVSLCETSVREKCVSIFQVCTVYVIAKELRM